MPQRPALPWAIAGVNKFLLTVFELAATFFVCQGLYAAADLTDLLLASCGEEVRTNRTLTTLLNKVYKVLIVVLGVMTMAQESGLPVGSIVASAGLVGLTISLAAQDSAKNLFSGWSSCWIARFPSATGSPWATFPARWWTSTSAPPKSARWITRCTS